MSDKVYNALKWIARYLLPALATLYFALSQIWELPYGEEIVGTLAAITAFLGVVLGISTAQYNKTNPLDGILQVDTCNEAKDTYRLSLSTGFDELKTKDIIKLRVDPNARLTNHSHEKHSL